MKSISQEVFRLIEDDDCTTEFIGGLVENIAFDEYETWRLSKDIEYKYHSILANKHPIPIKLAIIRREIRSINR